MVGSIFEFLYHLGCSGISALQGGQLSAFQVSALQRYFCLCYGHLPTHDVGTPIIGFVACLFTIVQTNLNVTEYLLAEK